MLHIFHILSSADFFSKSFFFRKILSGIPSVSSLNPDQAQHFVVPDLGPNCLERLSANNTRKQRVKAESNDEVPD